MESSKLAIITMALFVCLSLMSTLTEARYMPNERETNDGLADEEQGNIDPAYDYGVQVPSLFRFGKRHFPGMMRFGKRSVQADNSLGKRVSAIGGEGNDGKSKSD